MPLFLAYPEVHKAWELKEDFRAWYKETDKMKAEKRLAALGEKMIQSGLPEFRSLLPMFSNWHDEILNYFDYRITHSFVEGKNNRIKTIKRMAYGYRNMDNFRMRILATNPGCRGKLSHLLT
jgi:transposase